MLPFFESRHTSRDENILSGFICDKHIVRCDTCLTQIHAFAPHDPFCCLFHICTWVQEHGATKQIHILYNLGKNLLENTRKIGHNRFLNNMLHQTQHKASKMKIRVNIKNQQ